MAAHHEVGSVEQNIGHFVYDAIVFELILPSISKYQRRRTRKRRNIVIRISQYSYLALA